MSSNNARRVARLMAAQILYDASFEQESLDEILVNAAQAPQDFLEDVPDGAPMTEKPDHALLATVVRGAFLMREELTEMLAGALDARLSPARLEPLLRAILLAGMYELYRCPEVPTGIIVNDYVDVAHAFYGDKEPGLVNAVLDKLAKKLRS